MAELEARLLFFTASVVLLACASFAFDGTCAAWQWYVPLVLASVWFRGRYPTLIFACFLFTAALLSFGVGLILDAVKKQSDQAFELSLLKR